VQLDDETDAQVRSALEVDPSILLSGETPVLLDEWQVAPALWNLVRHEVDRRRLPGQFILTGSATPDDSARRHSGAGRFSIITMRPMSLYESGLSTGEVSLSELFDGITPTGFSPSWNATDARHEIAQAIVVGGWPGNIGKSVAAAARANNDYLRVLREYDIERATGVARDPETAQKVMRSLARNVATPAREATIARDASEGEEGRGPDATSRATVAGHLDALRRLRVIEDQPAWSPNLRSAVSLRTSPKRHFVDPSLAAAALRIDAHRLAADTLTLGLWFESLAVKDLRVYSQPLGASVSYYRDDKRTEVDAVIQLPDGRWGAFEVKLGTAKETIDTAATTLLRMASRVADNRRAFLAVLTNGGIAHRRDDGVLVVPARMLRP